MKRLLPLLVLALAVAAPPLPGRAQSRLKPPALEIIGRKPSIDADIENPNFEWMEWGWDGDTLGAFYLKSKARGTGTVRNFGFWDTGLNFYAPNGVARITIEGDTGSIMPGADNTPSLGSNLSKRWAGVYAVKVCYVTNTVCDFAGSGSPESVVAASVGSTYRRTDGAAATSFYVKESGTGNTGWAAK